MTTGEAESCVVVVIAAVAPRGALMEDRWGGQGFVWECRVESLEETGFMRLTAPFKTYNVSFFNQLSVTVSV